MTELGGEETKMTADGDFVNLAIAGKGYISSKMPKEVLVKAMEEAVILEK